MENVWDEILNGHWISSGKTWNPKVSKILEEARRVKLKIKRLCIVNDEAQSSGLDYIHC